MRTPDEQRMDEPKMGVPKRDARKTVSLKTGGLWRDALTMDEPTCRAIPSQHGGLDAWDLPAQACGHASVSLAG